MSNGILGLLAVGAAVGIGVLVYNKSAAAANNDPTPQPPQAVTGASGVKYVIQMTGHTETSEGNHLTFDLFDEDGNYILTYTQFQGDNDHRILASDPRQDMSSNGLIQAVQDFGILSSQPVS